MTIRARRSSTAADRPRGGVNLRRECRRTWCLRSCLRRDPQAVASGSAHWRRYTCAMVRPTLSDKLVVAISSRAVRLVREPPIFVSRASTLTSAIRSSTRTRSCSPAFGLAKLLHLNRPDKQYVEVLLLSRNSADTGLRVFNSIKRLRARHHAPFTKGEPTSRYAGVRMHLFLADTGRQARSTRATPRRPSFPTFSATRPTSCASLTATRCCSRRGRARLPGEGSAAFSRSESDAALEPLMGGPFRVRRLHRIQADFPRTRVRSNRAGDGAGAPAHERVIRTLRAWNIASTRRCSRRPGQGDPCAFGADIFFDDQRRRFRVQHVTTGHATRHRQRVARTIIGRSRVDSRGTDGWPRWYGWSRAMALSLMLALLAGSGDAADILPARPHRCGAKQAFAATSARRGGRHLDPGRGSYTATRGVSDIKTRQPIRIDDHFRIGSINKLRRRFCLSSPTRESSASTTREQVRRVGAQRRQDHAAHAGRHDGGAAQLHRGRRVGEDRLQSRAYGPARELVDVGLKSPPDFAPGQGWHYSNTNVLLGMILDGCRQKEIQDAFAEKMFKPLKLTQTLAGRRRAANPTRTAPPCNPRRARRRGPPRSELGVHGRRARLHDGRSAHLGRVVCDRLARLAGNAKAAAYLDDPAAQHA